MSGGSLRSVEMNRSNSNWCLIGSIDVMPSAKQITELAAAAAPLAEDLLAERELDDRIDGEEIGRIAHLLDQPEFVREQILMLLRRLAGELVLEAVPRERMQRLLRGPAEDYIFVGILVLQLAQREGAAFGDRLARAQGSGIVAKAPGHLLGRFEMPVGAALAAEAELVDRAFLADRSDDVLQHAAIGTS